MEFELMFACLFFLQHQEKPYCNGCYQRLFGQEGFRQGVLRTKQVALQPEDEQTAAEK